MLEWKDIELQDYARMQNLHTISDIDRQVVALLYQPIIGANAVALYHFFVTFAKQQKRLQHQTILRMLRCDIKDFTFSRRALEGIGLLKTYRTTDDDKDKYIYDVQAPVTPYAFFNDPVYCGLLKDYIGEYHFKELKSEFMVTPIDLTGYTEISQNFGQAFGNHLNLYTDTESVIGENKAKLSLENKAFDWSFFHTLIIGTYITEEQLTADVKQAILTIHQLYQTSPMDMFEYVRQAHSVAHNKIDVARLYHIARENRVKGKQPFVEPEHSPMQQTQSSAYPQGVQQLITACYQQAPTVFLENLKLQKSQQQANGKYYQVENAELKIVESLTRDFQFSPPLVNMLIYYVLIVAGASSLSEAHVKRIANSWIKENITSPEQAIDFVKNWKAQKNTTQEKTKKSKAVKVIQMTEEEKKALHDQDVPMDEEEWKKLFM